MPKNPLKFARRKSAGFEETPTVPTVSSFRVLERPDKINFNSDDRSFAARPVTRPFNSPLTNLNVASTDRLDVSPTRASGGTIRSASSGYNESCSASARHSSTSTLPSSVDADKEPDDEELFPRKSTIAPAFEDIPLNDNERLPASAPFTARTPRALTVGQRHNRAQSDMPLPPVRPKNVASSPERRGGPQRERAMTTSSYASTAKPDIHMDTDPSGLEADFGYMFNRPASGDKWDVRAHSASPVSFPHRTETEPLYPPRAHSPSSRRGSPDISRDDPGSPFGWERRNSNDRLIASSPRGSPTLDAPPVPVHRQIFSTQPKDGYSMVPDRSSPPRFSPSGRNSFLGEQLREEDEIDHFNPNHTFQTREPSGPSGSRYGTSPQSQARRPYGYPSGAAGAASRRNGHTMDSSEEDDSMFESGSRNSTPRAAKWVVSRQEDGPMFDSSPSGPPSRAIRPQPNRSGSGTPKKMTKAQFERLQRQGESSVDQSEEDEEQNDVDEYDDEDDAERARQMAKQRQRQEANMSVYRQQMKKVTGGTPPVIRPSFGRASASAPAGDSSVYLGGMGGQQPTDAGRGTPSDDEDEDVPLGILQAHGFPHSNRPASRGPESDLASQRHTPPAPSSVASGRSPGNLPPFARRLPADPYYGAGLVQPAARESLGMSGAASVYGGSVAGPPPPSMGHPGGLVGVIAGEERAKAARRGSPNLMAGGFGPAPLPSNMSTRSVSMGSIMPPQTYHPSGMGAMPMPMMGMPGMPMMSNQHPDQMHFMQMQMQFMQNMLAMQQQQQTGQITPPQQQPSPDFLSVPSPGGHARANSAPSVKSGRTMSMMSPTSAWGVPQVAPRPQTCAPPSAFNVPHKGVPTGYTPSIAPSERSNVGMPSRYRPVTTTTNSDGSSRTLSMSSSMLSAGNTNTNNSSPSASEVGKSQEKATIRAIDKPKGTPKSVISSLSATTDDDDDEGWADLLKKRAEKKKKFRFGGGRKGQELSTEELVSHLN